MSLRGSSSSLAKVALIATVSTMWFCPIARGQTTDPSDYAQGLILDSREKLNTIPRSPTFRDSLPENVDLSRHFPEPGDQGRQGSCTAWAVGYAARAYYSVKIEGGARNDRGRIPSPAYIYNSIKGVGSCRTTGASLSNALELLRDSGSLALDVYPYNEDSCDAPSAELKRRADGFRIDGYRWLDADDKRSIVDNIKGQLAQNNPVILAIKTTQSFHRLRNGEIYKNPTQCSSKDGHCNHAITAVGYDDSIQAFKLINSWGKDWASRGFTWIDYDTLKSELHAAYVMSVSLPPPPPVCSLSAEPAIITRGESSTLNYRAENAAAVEFDNGLGSDDRLGGRPAYGVKIVSPSRTTVYTATLKGRGGGKVCSARVVVQEPQPIQVPPVIASFDAKPATILPGQSGTLAWSVAGATNLRIDPPVGPLASGSIQIKPIDTTTYTLTASNAAGSTTSSTTVTVKPPSPTNLPDVDCGKISLIERGGKRTVVGFVKRDEDLARIRQAAPEAQLDVQVRPFPQCEALLTLAKPLSAVDRPKVTIRKTSNNSLTEGDLLVFEIETPSYPSYIHVAYLQADGSVVHLVQPGDGSFTAYKPNSKIVIGDGSNGGRRIRVSRPFGGEMLLVTAGRSPLFPDPRPKQETEREFLSALRRALLYKPDPSAPDRHVVAGIDTVITKQRADP